MLPSKDALDQSYARVGGFHCANLPVSTKSPTSYWNDDSNGEKFNSHSNLDRELANAVATHLVCNVCILCIGVSLKLTAESFWSPRLPLGNVRVL